EAEIGLPPGIRPDFSGTAQAFQQSLASEPVLILAALITVYIVLGVLYESYIHPVTILSTLPSAGVGALLALMVCRTDFSIIALIGIILLIGIVKKNAIMMIDFALEAEREQGLPPREAIHQACLLRFRPIMMTTMAPLPRVDSPTINVGAGLPGGSPETMASAVATPLERRFGRIAGITEITSSSTLGQTNLTLQFDLDRDVDSAARDVQAAINAASGDLPQNLPSRPNY